MILRLVSAVGVEAIAAGVSCLSDLTKLRTVVCQFLFHVCLLTDVNHLSLLIIALYAC